MRKSIIFSLLLYAVLYGQVPFTFDSNTVAKASEVNSNFDYIFNKIDSLSNLIDTLKNENDSLTGQMNLLQSKFDLVLNKTDSMSYVIDTLHNIIYSQNDTILSSLEEKVHNTNYLAETDGFVLCSGYSIQIQISIDGKVIASEEGKLSNSYYSSAFVPVKKGANWAVNKVSGENPAIYWCAISKYKLPN